MSQPQEWRDSLNLISGLLRVRAPMGMTAFHQETAGLRDDLTSRQSLYDKWIFVLWLTQYLDLYAFMVLTVRDNPRSSEFMVEFVRLRHRMLGLTGKINTGSATDDELDRIRMDVLAFAGSVADAVEGIS